MIGETNAPLRQRVERGRVDHGIAVAPQVAPAEVVGENKEDVGSAGCSRMAGGPFGRTEHNGQHEQSQPHQDNAEVQ